VDATYGLGRRGARQSQPSQEVRACMRSLSPPTPESSSALRAAACSPRSPSDIRSRAGTPLARRGSVRTASRSPSPGGVLPPGSGVHFDRSDPHAQQIDASIATHVLHAWPTRRSLPGCQGGRETKKLMEMAYGPSRSASPPRVKASSKPSDNIMSRRVAPGSQQAAQPKIVPLAGEALPRGGKKTFAVNRAVLRPATEILPASPRSPRSPLSEATSRSSVAGWKPPRRFTISHAGTSSPTGPAWTP
jgi:hypothetical protein